MYRLMCPYSDCSLYELERECKTKLDKSDERRICSGTCEDGNRCGRILDLIDDEIHDHVPSDRPPPPEPPPEPTLEEKRAAAFAQLRQQRRAALEASDWTQLPDVRLTAQQKVEVATYRKALRDITDTPDPESAEFPEPPSWLGTR